jgi:hypothetical protein
MSSTPEWFKRLFGEWSIGRGNGPSIYENAGPGPWSVGGGAPPTIYDRGGLPADVVGRGMDTMRYQLPQGASGRITQMPPESAPMSAPMPPMSAGQIAPMPRPVAVQIAPPPRSYPSYDYEAFDRAIAPHVGDGGITEGPNRNIDEETRLKALRWVLERQG